MRSSKMMFAVLSVITAQVALAWDNTPPIPERHPGWGVGKGK